MSEAGPFGRCGTFCPECQLFGPTCAGCGSVPGGAFWCGEGASCAVYACAVRRGLEHCGLCGEFPCETLLDYAYHPEHGDRERVGDCAIRAHIGTAAWAAREASWREARAKLRK